MDEEGRAYEDGLRHGLKFTRPLTEEVITKLWGGFSDDMNRQQAMSFARAIERAHGIGEKE